MPITCTFGKNLSPMRILLFILIAGVLLSNCSINRKTSILTNNECEILAKKRAVGKKSKQPKMKSGLYAKAAKEKSVNKNIGTQALHVNPFPFKIDSASIYASTDRKIFYEKPRHGDSHPLTKSASNITTLTAVETFQNTCTSDNVKRTLKITHEATALIAVSAVASICLIMLATPYFMRVSASAAHHPIATKAILAGIHTVTSTGALLAGNVLSNFGFSLPTYMLIGGVISAGTAIYLYPRKGKSLSNFTNKYRLHKICDALLFTSGIALVGFAGNNLGDTHPISTFTSTYVAPEIPIPKSTAKIYENKKVEKVNQERPNKKKTGLKFLVGFLFVLLTIGVAAVSCGLICSGQGLLAAVFGIGAEVVLVLLMNHFLRKLNGKTKKETPPQPVGARI